MMIRSLNGNATLKNDNAVWILKKLIFELDMYKNKKIAKPWLES